MKTTPEYTMRDATPDDEDFLFSLYASSRAMEINALAWSPEAAEHFLRMQYRARSGAYSASHPGARDRIVLSSGERVGRILVDWTVDPVVLVDVALVPERQGKGIGSALIRDLLAEAAARGTVVELHVDIANPARRLYERAGFAEVARDALRATMRWHPG